MRLRPDGKFMTSSANDEWNYEELMDGIRFLQRSTGQWDGKYTYQHLIDFIEYRMRELEITGGIGDE